MISIIIVNYFVAALIKNLVESILKYEKSTKIEIIIVDNKSCVKELGDLKKYSFVKIIKLEKNVGFAAANNIGVKEAKGKYILLLNPDTLLIESSIHKIIKYREKLNRPCIIGVKLLNPDLTYQNSMHTFPNIIDYLFVAFFVNTIFKKSKIINRYNYGWKSKDNIYRVDSVKGAFLFVDKELYLNLQGMDENFFLFSEEVDLCYRAMKSGIEIIYYANTSIIHFGGQSTKLAKEDNFIKQYIGILSFILKHKSIYYAHIFRVVLLITTFNRSIFNFIISIFKNDYEFYKNKSIIFYEAFIWLFKCDLKKDIRLYARFSKY